MERLICLAIGYAFGLIQTAYIYGKMHHIDIREHGSGNAGTTNALRTLGKKAGLIVFLGDLLKVVVATIVVRLIFKDSHPESLTLLVLYAGFGAVLGHNFPVYLKFKGGKGIAATGGLIIALGRWELILVGLTVFVLSVVVSKYVSVGSLLMVFTVYITFAIMDYFGLIGGLEPQNIAYEAMVIFFLFVVLAFVRHRANIVRLFKGTENKLSFKKKTEVK